MPPHGIVRTPGGKIRHAAKLKQFERGGETMAPRPFWRQFADTLQRSLYGRGRYSLDAVCWPQMLQGR